MAETSTYSFKDLAGSIAHPLAGYYDFTGQGLGEITIAMSTEKTAHDVAADGAIMGTFIPGNNGIVTITVQQTSDFHKWLLALYNLLLNAGTSNWMGIGILFRNVNDGTSHVVTGASFQKLGDKVYQQQGQRVSWSLMAAEIQNLTV